MMFKAGKNLQRGKKENLYVHIGKGKCVTEENKVIQQIREYFYEHFHDDRVPSIEPFEGNPRKLNLPITTEQVVNTVNKMSNNKSSDFDNVTGEMIKYGPHILHQEITNNLNNIFKSHSKEIDIGRSILKPLPKPNKSKGPCKNLNQ